MVVNTREEIDIRNINGANIQLDEDRLLMEIVRKFDIGEDLAKKWNDEAKKLHRENHDLNIRQEMRAKYE